MRRLLIFDLPLAAVVLVGGGLLAGAGFGVVALRRPEEVFGSLALATLALIAGRSAMAISRGSGWPRVIESGAWAAILALGLWLIEIWFGASFPVLRGPLWDDMATTCAGWAGGALALGVLHAEAPRTALQRVLHRIARWATWGLLGLTGLLVWTGDIVENPALRVFTVAAVLAGSTVAVALLATRLGAEQSDDGGSADPGLPFEAVCPRCGASQNLRTGVAACGVCGLAITVRAP